MGTLEDFCKRNLIGYFAKDGWFIATKRGGRVSASALELLLKRNGARFLKKLYLTKVEQAKLVEAYRKMHITYTIWGLESIRNEMLEFYVQRRKGKKLGEFKKLRKRINKKTGILRWV